MNNWFKAGWLLSLSKYSIRRGDTSLLKLMKTKVNNKKRQKKIHAKKLKIRQ
jgi:hypothetical protein